MVTHHNKYRGLGSGPILREAGAGGSNPLTPTIFFDDLSRDLASAFQGKIAS